MTTTIKVISHSYPALVETFDRIYDHDRQRLSDTLTKTAEQIVQAKTAADKRFRACDLERRVYDRVWNRCKRQAIERSL